MKQMLGTLRALLQKIQKDHKGAVSSPFWAGEQCSDPEYEGSLNEDAMHKREDQFRELSKEAREQLEQMERLTQVRGRLFNRNAPWYIHA